MLPTGACKTVFYFSLTIMTGNAIVIEQERHFSGHWLKVSMQNAGKPGKLYLLNSSGRLLRQVVLTATCTVIDISQLEEQQVQVRVETVHETVQQWLDL